MVRRKYFEITSLYCLVICKVEHLSFEVEKMILFDFFVCSGKAQARAKGQKKTTLAMPHITNLAPFQGTSLSNQVNSVLPFFYSYFCFN